MKIFLKLITIGLLTGLCVFAIRQAFPGEGAAAPDFTETEARPAASLVNYARSLEGSEYFGGGCEPETGFDCSGLVQHVFEKFDLKLPRSSRGQSKAGEAVELEVVEPGDLLYFTGRNAQSDRVGHVGIVVSADSVVAFIHASTSRGVRVDSLSSPYWAARIRGARRVF